MSKLLLCSAIVVAAGLSFAPQGPSAAGDVVAQAAPAQEVVVATPIVLSKRVDDGPYGKSAYSFRYATQDLAIHKNSVDLVWNGCGLLHVCPEAGLKNRIAKVPVTALASVRDFPSGGWKSDCIAPEAAAIYVMEIDDGTTKMRVKIRVVSMTPTELKLEYLPFRDMNMGAGSTMGKCSGKHGCK